MLNSNIFLFFKLNYRMIYQLFDRNRLKFNRALYVRFFFIFLFFYLYAFDCLSFFVFKKYKKPIEYLNSPNRHKKSQTKLFMNEYILILKINYVFLRNALCFLKKIHFFFFLKKYFFFFESSLFSLYKINFIFILMSIYFVDIFTFFPIIFIVLYNIYLYLFTLGFFSTTVNIFLDKVYVRNYLNFNFFFLANFICILYIFHFFLYFFMF